MDYNEEQRSYAQIAAECNADIVIGHHPHVVQPMEELKRSDGKFMPVAYSLGNFISSQNEFETMLGGMLVAEFEKSGTDAKIKKAGFSPVITHYGKNYSDVTVYLWDDYNEELAKEHGIREFDYDKISSIIEHTIDNKYLSVGHEFVH